jgi:acyl-CoA synthetase (AMP-forming)/AMP-acid ligase II
VRVVDDQDRELPAGETGGVVVRSDVVMRSYLHLPEATRTALRGGWLHTGDLGSFDTRGFLTLRDHSKDVIISGGSNIYPHEVEEVLLTHPEVVEAAVVGQRSADWGEEVCAFVVRRPGSSLGTEALDAL